jgi:hypothetical protein
MRQQEEDAESEEPGGNEKGTHKEKDVGKMPD